MSILSLRHLSRLSIGTSIAALMLIGSSMSGQAAPKAVASIKPLHSLVAMVMEGVEQPDLLLKGTTSPHNFALKPSQAVLLNEADLIFWIGHELETALEKPLSSLSGDSRVLSLMETDDLTLHNYRDVDDFAIDTHIAKDSDHGDDDGHAHHEHAGGTDPHIWLDPRNAALALDAIANALAEQDSENAEQYRANATAGKVKIAALETEIADMLTESSDAKFVLFHDGFQYFEKRFGLQASGVILLNPETLPGASQVSAIRDLIVDEAVTCVFNEPQFNPKLAETVIESTGATTHLLDPIGVDLPVGSDMYFSLLRAIGKSYADCLN